MESSQSTIGVRTFRDIEHCDIPPGMLAMPFVGKLAGFAINRRKWVNAEEAYERFNHSE